LLKGLSLWDLGLIGLAALPFAGLAINLEAARRNPEACFSAEDPTICVELQMKYEEMDRREAEAGARASAQIVAQSRVRTAVESEPGEPLRGYEYFLHGTSENVAEEFQLEPGKRFFTTTSATAARVFAERTVAKQGYGNVGGVALILPKAAFDRIKQQRLLTVKPIDDMPQFIEWIFEPGAYEILRTEGIIITLPRGSL
jgi:hypothetical protein